MQMQIEALKFTMAESAHTAKVEARPIQFL
jgi:hypothetical protein